MLPKGRGTLPKGRGTLPKGRGTLPKGRGTLPKGRDMEGTNASDKSVGQKCGTQVSDKSVGQQCRTKVSDKSVGQSAGQSVGQIGGRGQNHKKRVMILEEGALSDLRPPAKGKARARPTEGKGARAARARERRQQLHRVVDVREGWMPFGKFGLGADLRHDGKRKRGIEWVRRGMNRRAGGEGTRSREKVGRAARTGASACGAEACTSRESKSGDSGERWLGSATRSSGALFGILILVDEGAWPGQASSRLCVRRKRLAIRAGGARQAEASREHAHVNAARRHRSRRKSWGRLRTKALFPFSLTG